MPPVLKLRATVLEGSRIEFSVPELPAGSEVEISVSPCGLETERPRLQEGGVADYLASLPPVGRSSEEWAAIDREILQERDRWDR